jgi:hypothetical protein
MISCYLKKLLNEDASRDGAAKRSHPEREFRFLTTDRNCRHLVTPRVGLARCSAGTHLTLITVTVVCDVGDVDRHVGVAISRRVLLSSPYYLTNRTVDHRRNLYRVELLDVLYCTILEMRIADRTTSIASGFLVEYPAALVGSCPG